MNNWLDEMYLFFVLALSSYAVYHTKGNADVAIAVLALNAGAIAFVKWNNGKGKE